jgi:hypothetical protein
MPAMSCPQLRIINSAWQNTLLLRTDLRKEDFILEEEGKPVEIEYFARETDFPLPFM